MGSRPSALAISTICLRDNGRSPTAHSRGSISQPREPEQFLRPVSSRPSVDETRGTGDVVGDREIRQDRQFLEDADDAGRISCVLRRSKLSVLAVESHRAPIQ